MKTLPSNYRFISILSNINKSLESIINSKIMKYLEWLKLIQVRQYELRHQRLTTDLLTFIYRSVYLCLEQVRVTPWWIVNYRSWHLHGIWYAAFPNKLLSYFIHLKLCTWVNTAISSKGNIKRSFVSKFKHIDML